MNCPTALASSTDIAEHVVAMVDRQRAQPGPSKTVLAVWLGGEASREARDLFAAQSIARFATSAVAVGSFMQLVG
jgi:acetyltransferase